MRYLKIGGVCIKRNLVRLTLLLLFALFSYILLAYFNGWLYVRPDFLPDDATHIRVYVGGPYGFTADGFEAIKAKINTADFEEIISKFGLVKAVGVTEGFSGFERIINRWWWDPDTATGNYFVIPGQPTGETEVFAQYHNGNLYFVRSWGF